MMLSSVVNGESDQEKGKILLTLADRVLYPESATYTVDLTTSYEDNKTLTWGFEGYKKGMLKQTIVMTFPDIQRNDVGIRSGDVIYWKPRQWPKPQIMSYQAVFLESPLSYGDILSVDLNEDYSVKELKKKESGELTLILAPRKAGLYAKLEIVIDPETHYTLQRIFYTASGDILKTTSYSDYKTENGRVVSFTIYLDHKFMKISGSAKVANIQIESTPDFIYNPANIGRIHARKK
jgi:hypothetical protein